MELNDDLRKWMFPKTTALFPSLYDKEHKHAGNLRYNFVSAVMRETVRVNDLGLPILPYINPLQVQKYNVHCKKIHEICHPQE